MEKPSAKQPPLTARRFDRIAEAYPALRVAVVGDYCLDRYLEIDPDAGETSIETGLPVYSVHNVRSVPGAAGTILNNLLAMGIGRVHAIGFCGPEAEGHELLGTLSNLNRVDVSRFLQTPDRRTFVYCKPLILHESGPPEELSRFDMKNQTPTPEVLVERLATSVEEVAAEVDAMILMDQVDVPDTGVVTPAVREAAHRAAERYPGLLILADSRSGLGDYPPIGFKMNVSEFESMTGRSFHGDPEAVRSQATLMASRNGQPVFVTLAENGMVGAEANGESAHVAAHPVSGPIDVVGAGDSVTANLAAARAAGASLGESMQIAMAAASHVVHQLGTTGTATPKEVAEKLKIL